MKTTDDVARQIDYNFAPGDFVRHVAPTPANVGDTALILSVDYVMMTCHVMWSLSNGGVRFGTPFMFTLKRA